MTDLTFDDRDVNRPVPTGLTATPTGVHPEMSKVEASEVYALSDGTFLVPSPLLVDESSQRFDGMASEEVALWWVDAEGTPLVDEQDEQGILMAMLGIAPPPIFYAGTVQGTLDPVLALREVGVEVAA